MHKVWTPRRQSDHHLIPENISASSLGSRIITRKGFPSGANSSYAVVSLPPNSIRSFCMYLTALKFDLTLKTFILFVVAFLIFKERPWLIASPGRVVVLLALCTILWLNQACPFLLFIDHCEYSQSWLSRESTKLEDSEETWVSNAKGCRGWGILRVS